MSHKKIVSIVFIILCLIPLESIGAKKFTLVIDAGHGGKDTGACGKISKEKTLTLRYALAFGKMVEQNCPDVKVIYTRKTDHFLELWQRAEIANKNKADLFISVHINALPKGRIARGFQTYTLGRGRNTGKAGFIENLEVAKRENEAILLEDNYLQTYQGYDPRSPESDILFEFMQDDNMLNSVELAKLMQKHVCAATGRQDQGAHQDNLAVLRLTSMPGCLLELGFISTTDEEQFMNAESSTEKYARGMLKAFQDYRRKIGNVPQTIAKPKEEKKVQEEKPVQQPQQDQTPQQPQTTQTPQTTQAPQDDAPVFKVQFLTSGTRLKAGSREFKGLTNVGDYKEGGIWKYTVGSSTDYDEICRLRKEVSVKFPQAFVIAFKDGARMDIEKARQEYRKRKK